tara:strand:- start:575 stop:1081 length:507 start_codon:yes stop_codon:yes gene_type:complete
MAFADKDMEFEDRDDNEFEFLRAACIRDSNPKPRRLDAFPNAKLKEHFIELQLLIRCHHKGHEQEYFPAAVRSLMILRKHFNSEDNVFYALKEVNDTKRNITTEYIKHMHFPNCAYKPAISDDLRKYIKEAAPYAQELILSSTVNEETKKCMKKYLNWLKSLKSPKSR